MEKGWVALAAGFPPRRSLRHLGARGRSCSRPTWRGLLSASSRAPPGISALIACWEKEVSVQSLRDGSMSTLSRRLSLGPDSLLQWRGSIRKVYKVTGNGWWVPLASCLLCNIRNQWRYVSIVIETKVSINLHEWNRLKWIILVSFTTQTSSNWLDIAWRMNIVCWSMSLCLEEAWSIISSGVSSKIVIVPISFAKLLLYLTRIFRLNRGFIFPSSFLEPPDEGCSWSRKRTGFSS